MFKSNIDLIIEEYLQNFLIPTRFDGKIEYIRPGERSAGFEDLVGVSVSFAEFLEACPVPSREQETLAFLLEYSEVRHAIGQEIERLGFRSIRLIGIGKIALVFSTVCDQLLHLMDVSDNINTPRPLLPSILQPLHCKEYQTSDHGRFKLEVIHHLDTSQNDPVLTEHLRKSVRGYGYKDLDVDDVNYGTIRDRETGQLIPLLFDTNRLFKDKSNTKPKVYAPKMWVTASGHWKQQLALPQQIKGTLTPQHLEALKQTPAGEKYAQLISDYGWYLPDCLNHLAKNRQLSPEEKLDIFLIVVDKRYSPKLDRKFLPCTPLRPKGIFEKTLKIFVPRL